MRIGLREVARRAGVSESSVSRVVNNRNGVSDTTRALVHGAIEELGYEERGLHINPGAGFVGLIVPELQNPIFPAFAQAIETSLAAETYACVLCTAARGGMQEPGYIDLLMKRGVAGIIVVSGIHANTEWDHGIYRHVLSLQLNLQDQVRRLS